MGNMTSDYGQSSWWWSFSVYINTNHFWEHLDSVIYNLQVTSFEPYTSLRRTVRWIPCVSHRQSSLTIKPTFACVVNCYSARLSTLSGQYFFHLSSSVQPSVWCQADIKIDDHQVYQVLPSCTRDVIWRQIIVNWLTKWTLKPSSQFLASTCLRNNNKITNSFS